MRTVAFVALLMMAGCGQDEMVSSVPKDASGLYSISADGSTVTVPGGAVWYTEPAVPPFTLASFAVSCFRLEDKDVKRAELLFRRADAAAPWRFERVNWFMGRCE